MTVTVTDPGGADRRGAVHDIELSASGDVAQAWLRSDDGVGLNWFAGEVSWYRTASVTVTFTNAGADAMAISGGNGVLAGWQAHPDAAQRQAAETLPITGLRFAATAADQSVRLYVGKALAAPPVDAGTPA